MLDQPIYQPGKPIDDVARELGLDPAGIIKLASNENALGASPLAMEAARRALKDLSLYPDGSCYRLKRALAERWGLGSDQFVIGNGSNEVLELLGHAFIGPGDEAVMGQGAFIVYKLVTLLFGGRPVEVPMRNYRHDTAAMAAAVTDRTKIVFLPSPDNPSGSRNTNEEIHELIESLPAHVLFVLDEAYAEYLEDGPDLRPYLQRGKRVFGTRTFSKIYGLAGLRVGYGFGDPELVGLLNRPREPFNVNSVAQAAAVAALSDIAWVKRCREANAGGLEQLQRGLVQLGLPYIPSSGNFITAKVGQAAEAFGFLQKRGVIVRPLAPYGLPEWIRVTVGLPEQNERVLAELNSFLNS